MNETNDTIPCSKTNVYNLYRKYKDKIKVKNKIKQYENGELSEDEMMDVIQKSNKNVYKKKKTTSARKCMIDLTTKIGRSIKKKSNKLFTDGYSS